ncbi:MAG TPA: hypothetical protein PLP04_11520, partial [Bryobacteraceae bacterium]|nr:hypothetical protein [Bryobacteraceae bacterium]
DVDRLAPEPAEVAVGLVDAIVELQQRAAIGARGIIQPGERGLEHHEYFIKSLRENLPSMETAEEGHYAAGAAHLGNLAYRKKRRIRWNIETNKVSEG